jgi:hypothetical protein
MFSFLKKMKSNVLLMKEYSMGDTCPMCHKGQMAMSTAPSFAGTMFCTECHWEPKSGGNEYQKNLIRMHAPKGDPNGGFVPTDNKYLNYMT